MGLFSKKRPAVLDYTSAVNPPPRMGDPLASLGGYDRNAAMQGQSGFAPMNEGFTPPAQKKPGFFSKGGAWLDVLGAFGDGFGTNGPVYAQSKMQKNRLMQEQQMMEQKQQQDRERFLFEESYKRANPMPINNDTVNDLNWYKSLSEEDRKLYHQMNPEYRQGPDGRFYRVDTAQGPLPTFTPADWDKGQPVGGPVQNAPVTFSGQ